MEQFWQQFWQHWLLTRVIDFEGSRLCVRGFEKEIFVKTHPGHTESTDALSRAASVLSDAAYTQQESFMKIQNLNFVPSEANRQMIDFPDVGVKAVMCSLTVHPVTKDLHKDGFMALGISTSTFLFDNRGTVALFSPWRCLRFSYRQRDGHSCLATETPWRFSPVEVPQILRGLHSPVSGACFGAGRRTDRRSGSAPQTCECIPCPPSCTTLPRMWMVLAQLDVGRKPICAQERCLPIADRARLILAKLRLPALGAVLTVFSEKD